MHTFLQAYGICANVPSIAPPMRMADAAVRRRRPVVADDLNLLAVARKAGETRDILERAWEVCETWARTRGMQFASQKKELMHFTRVRAPITQCVRIGGADAEPQVIARFLD